MSFSGGWGRSVLVSMMATALIACGDDGTMDGPDAAFVCATDNHCDDLVFCNGEEVCAPAAAGADARGCVQQDEPCMEGQTCDEDAQTCETDCATGGDADGDGVDSMDCGGTDCDDSDDTRYPGNTEVCDTEGHDEDCDPMTVGDTDLDEDGVIDAACCNEGEGGTLMCGADCDDSRPDVSGTAVEACDGADNDCDGDIDEGVLATWYEDADGDGFSSMEAGAEIMMACEQPTGFAAMRTDCDDSSAASNPSAPEVCDGLDNDCDTTTDEDTVDVEWYRDADGDSYGEFSTTPIESCTPVTGHVTRDGDCDDTDEDINPLAEDICDGVDNDCDGMLEGPGEDEDADGFASLACGGDDCDDTRNTAFPGATEICNRLDDDCSTGGGPETSEDVDDDGFAPPSSSCSAVGGFPKTDCDDARSEAFPGATETCNRLDDNCSDGGGSDNTEDVDGDGYSAPGAACTGGFAKTDCNDNASTINPGATEICDLSDIDDDCDGIPNQTCPSGLWTGAPFNGGTISTSPAHCEPGYGLVGVHARIGSWDSFSDVVNRLAGRCEAFEVVQTGTDSFDIGWNDDLSATRVRPFSEGSLGDMETACPPGEFVVGLTFWTTAANEPMVGFRIQCSALRIRNSGGAWVLELDTTSGGTESFGQTSGAISLTADCASSGRVGVGLTGTRAGPGSTAAPESLGLRCADSELRLGLDGGCADTTREGFSDEATHPDVAACAGEWGVAGMRGMAASCGRRSGDDFDPIPTMTSCTVEDLCAEGWHVCTSAGDLDGSTDCSGIDQNVDDTAYGFFATAQGGNGSACTASGTNDIYGCGDGTAASCAPLDRTAGDSCGAVFGLDCSSSTNEIGTAVNTNYNSAGVLCCRD